MKEDPEMKDRHLAHIGDFLSRFTCKAAKVVEAGEANKGARVPAMLS